jgi:hypothetical protein
MLFDEIWESLCKKKPELKDPNTKLEFTSENLKKLLLQVYEKGQKEPLKEVEQIDFMNVFSQYIKK